MGAKTWMIVYSNGDVPSIWGREPKVNHARNPAILSKLFPGKKYNEIENETLASTCPNTGYVQIADLDKILVVATDIVAIDHPSKIPPNVLRFENYKYTYIFAMHSAVDWFSFAIWENGNLIRSLSLSPDSGIIEDIGAHLSFEEDYWNNKHPAVDPEDEEDDYPLAFHPLEFGENTLLNLMGFQYEGVVSSNKVDPENITMHCFREKSWWKFW